MTNLELLAPAKNLECGIAAINHGADAVYIGAQRFGARAAAGNSTQDIAALCRYAHTYGAKVYVTVNTIIYDDELADTINLCKELQSIGTDAILVQDMGLTSNIQGLMNLHASTQTDNRTAEKVKWLSSLGFKRVVLARELSIDEIATIHKIVPEVELEVFVHGALCVSYSGQCYASYHCFQRSANRGECAQFCRMPMHLTDADGKVIERSRHLLSLKDLAQLENLKQLALAGAVSFKIEGRLKDVAYVKNITAAYSQALNDVCRKHPDKFQRASMGSCTYSFVPDIYKSFNRGFTTYFAKGRQQKIASFDTPKALGEPVGHVKEIKGRSFTIASTATFANGDGLCFFNNVRQLVGFRVNKAEGNRLFPLSMPAELRPGTPLYRNHDQAFELLLTKPSAERKILVNIKLHIKANTITLTMTDEWGFQRAATMPCEVQIAKTPQEENIRRQITKLGGTPYKAAEVTIETEIANPFIPSSMLANLRRKVLETEAERIENKKYKMSNKVSHCSAIPSPKYTVPYLYNAANQSAKEFYAVHGVDNAAAFENEGGSLIMQCRYCLRNELGYCTKSGHKAPWREPLTLTLDDGKSFTLRFNCSKCEMEVYG